MGWHKYKHKSGYYYRGRTKSGRYYTKGTGSGRYNSSGMVGIFEIILLIILLAFFYELFKPFMY